MRLSSLKRRRVAFPDEKKKKSSASAVVVDFVLVAVAFLSLIISS